MSKADFYHAITMASVDSIQDIDPSIPMLVVFDENNYSNESERDWRFGYRWPSRISYSPYKHCNQPKRNYNPPKIQIKKNYKPHMSLHRRCNSGSGWW